MTRENGRYRLSTMEQIILPIAFGLCVSLIGIGISKIGKEPQEEVSKAIVERDDRGNSINSPIGDAEYYDYSGWPPPDHEGTLWVKPVESFILSSGKDILTDKLIVIQVDEYGRVICSPGRGE